MPRCFSGASQLAKPMQTSRRDFNCALTKQQRHELLLASKPLGIPFCGVLLDRPSELPTRKQLQELRKNARYLSHG
jgi:hypothetical protein